MRLIAIFTIIFLFSGCSSSKEVPKSTLRVNFPTDPLTLDPRKGTDVTSSTLQFMLYEGLTRFTPLSTHDLGMADRITISEDRTRYTFHIRDARWSDGHPVSAHDFVYAWTTMLDPKFPCPNCNLLFPIKNAERVKFGNAPASQLGVRALDDTTLEVDLENPIPYFLELTSFCVYAPVPRHIAAHNRSWPDRDLKTVVSNGPYVLEKWKRCDEIVVKKAENYWDKGNVNHDGIHISIVDNQNTALQMYHNGDLDIMGAFFTPIPVDYVASLKQKGILQTKPVAATTFCTFNINTPPFTNKKIRKAFAAALNRNAIVENITLLNEEVGSSIIPSILRKGKRRDLVQSNQLKVARNLLEQGMQELGINRDSFRGVKFLYRNNDVNHKIAQELQQQWRRAFGIDLQLECAEHRTYLDRVQRRDYEIGIGFLYAQYNDQMNVLERFRVPSNPKNFPGFDNEEYKSVMAKVAQSTNEKERFALMEDAEDILIEECPITPIYHTNISYLTKPHLQNVQLSPLGAIHVPSISLKK